MQYGVCGPVDLLDEALAAGFDYVEPPAASLASAMDYAAYRRARPPVTNVFFPGEVRLFGPDATPYQDYAKRLFDRAAECGVQVMVIGSGGSRRAPDGMDLREADERFMDVVAELQAEATGRGIRLAPESLNHLETNVGNDLGALARSLRARGCAYTADSYHLLVEWWRTGPKQSAPGTEYMEQQMPHAPAHVHIADLPRLFPRSKDPMVRAFTTRLKELGYNARISLECGRLGIDGELAIALRELKRLCEEP